MAEKIVYQERPEHPVQALWESYWREYPAAFDATLQEFGWTLGDCHPGKETVDHLLFAPDGVFVVTFDQTSVPVDPKMVDINPILKSVASYDEQVDPESGCVTVPEFRNFHNEAVRSRVTKIDLSAEADVARVTKILTETNRAHQQDNQTLPEIEEIEELVKNGPEELPIYEVKKGQWENPTLKTWRAWRDDYGSESFYDDIPFGLTKPVELTPEMRACLPPSQKSLESITKPLQIQLLMVLEGPMVVLTYTGIDPNELDMNQLLRDIEVNPPEKDGLLAVKEVGVKKESKGGPAKALVAGLDFGGNRSHRDLARAVLSSFSHSSFSEEEFQADVDSLASDLYRKLVGIGETPTEPSNTGLVAKVKKGLGIK